MLKRTAFSIKDAECLLIAYSRCDDRARATWATEEEVQAGRERGHEVGIVDLARRISGPRKTACELMTHDICGHHHGARRQVVEQFL